MEVPYSKECQFSVYRPSSDKNLDHHIMHNFEVTKYMSLKFKISIGKDQLMMLP